VIQQNIYRGFVLGQILKQLFVVGKIIFQQYQKRFGKYFQNYFLIKEKKLINPLE